MKSTSASRATILIAVFSVVALLSVIAVRIAGPSDIYHQTQPRTVSYTTDILVNGRWVLPYEQDRIPATKPPLYNWLAVPFVRVIGFSSDLAHKMPSVLALIGGWAVLVWIGERSLTRSGEGDRRSGIGFLAALMFTATFLIFKLGYLARPDMLLTFFLMTAWAAATAILARPAAQRHSGPPLIVLQVILWGSVALAFLTKGPVAVIAIVFLPLAAVIVARDRRALRSFGWQWGLPLVLVVFGAWVASVYAISPEHLTQTLWGEEFYGRIVGQEDDPGKRTPLTLLTGALNMPVYFLLRGAPWSFLSVLAIIAIFRGGGPVERGVALWMRSAAVWVLTVLLITTLSAGKRADYIASCFGPGSLLAAWWWMRVVRRPIVAHPAAVVAAAAVISILVYVNEHELGAPFPGYGDSVNTFLDEAKPRLEDDPLHLYFWRLSGSHVPAYLGVSADHRLPALRDALRNEGAFWVIGGQRRDPPIEFDEQPYVTRSGLQVTRVLRSEKLNKNGEEPHRLTLYLLER